jgi:hypothetical protein
MGTPVGRIEKEFVFKALTDEGTPCDVHGSRREARCRLVAAGADQLGLEALEGDLAGFEPGEEVRVFFYLKNNYHTFSTKVLEAEPRRLVVAQPEGVYKNLQRKYERIRLGDGIEVTFALKGRKIELNFPRAERFRAVEPPEPSLGFDAGKIQGLIGEFRTKMADTCSRHKITMLRDRLPRTWEEKVVVRLGKCLWIPAVAEDFPTRDPFPDDRVITKADLLAFEEENGTRPSVIQSRLGNILYEKSKQDIAAELFCPILYNEYVVGYVHLVNEGERRDRMLRELVDYTWQFARVLCYSLVTNGYFRAENAGERRYEAPIIDISASGLLFAHPNQDLARELLVHTDLDLTLRIADRTIQAGSRIMRKFKDSENAYFGVLFMRMQPEDFRFLFEHLYGKRFSEQYEGVWEGGAPPPPLDL